MSKVDGFNAYQNSFFSAAMKDMPGFKGGPENRVDRRNETKADNSKVEDKNDKMAVSAKKTAETTGNVELSDKAKALLDELKQNLHDSDIEHIYSPEETLARARSRIGEDRYNLVLNNCEHFAIWCKTGLSKSYQVDDVLGMFADKRIPLLAMNT